MMVGFIVYFNEKRHNIAELREHFEDRVDEDQFYQGCSLLGEVLLDDEAAAAFRQVCIKFRHPAGQEVRPLTLQDHL
eukprot:SAG22_NODE_4795_length_1161_cov_1.096045_1_plen_77_part_00